MTPRRVVMLFSFVWCATIVLTPLLASSDGIAPKFAGVSYDFFSRVCHQLDSRSFHVAGYKFAVCIRCFAIYLFFTAGMALFPIIARKGLTRISSRSILLIGLTPMAIDVALAVLGVSESTPFTRAVTGSFFGLALGFVLNPALEDIFANLNQRNLPSAFNQRILRNLRKRFQQHANPDATQT